MNNAVIQVLSAYFRQRLLFPQRLRLSFGEAHDISEPLVRHMTFFETFFVTSTLYR